ncbi:hypothetical protein [Flavobacterium lindanitolerans]|uniref:hypothetical protein n=1 Tax=Flavobacterium lindanitolerans TaxID=428988 RepID=UPI0031A9DBB3
MQSIFRLHVVFIFFAATFSCYSQETDSQKNFISKTIEDYFFLERENIHLQLDKSVFISDEDVWFKGYVYHRKEEVPFFTTTNVYASLYDENGNRIKDKLLFSSMGSFSGKFELGDAFKSGNYYIQVFTNWMNNFKEDESSVFKFSVINKNDRTASIKNSPDYSKINIEFFPEGGSIIQGIQNTVGIKVSDCHGNPLPSIEGEIIGPEGKSIQKVSLNRFGLGKFQIFGDSKTSKASFLVNGKKVEENLPFASPNGLALEINNFALKDKTIVKIRTNEKNIASFKSKKHYLVVHQDNKSTIFDIDFKNAFEQTITFTKDNLSEGVNTVRIIDSDMKQLAERFIFKYPEESLKLDIKLLKKGKDSIHFSGNLNYANTSISISAVPEQSIAINQDYSIRASFLLNPYLSKNQSNTNYYFEEVSKAKEFELDLLLLTQSTGKYKWENIVTTPPKDNNTFDFGLTIKGTINQTLADRKKFKVKLFSLQSSISESTGINDKNEFYFNNMVLADSTWVNFTLTDDKNKPIVLKLYPQILNGRRTFNKPFKTEKKECASIEEKVEYETPSFVNGTIMLEDVEIAVEKKKKLKYSNSLGNGNLRGYKVAENDQTDVLNFIRNNGFEVPTINGFSNTVEIYSRSVTTINGARSTPILFIDGLQQMSFDLLLNMRMNEVDEIYINAHAIVPSVNNNIGIIKIYMKKGGSGLPQKNNAIPFEIKNAFSKIEPFKNKLYTSTENRGFQNFGLIHWIPAIYTHDSKEFKFQIPNMGQKKVKLLIEGFSAEGQLISETRTISLE